MTATTTTAAELKAAANAAYKAGNNEEGRRLTEAFKAQREIEAAANAIAHKAAVAARAEEVAAEKAAMAANQAAFDAARKAEMAATVASMTPAEKADLTNTISNQLMSALGYGTRNHSVIVTLTAASQQMDGFAKDVTTTVTKYGKVSEKQAYVIARALVAIGYANLV